MLEIKVWDVSHGNATHIHTPNGRNIIVDLGADQGQLSPLKEIRKAGISNLDAIVITHPHSDHIDDIRNLHLFKTGILHTTFHLTEDDIRKGNRQGDASIIDEYLSIKGACTFPCSPVHELSNPNNYGGVIFQVFAPNQYTSGNLNNHSLVVVVSYANLKMVIPGDNEAPSWKSLLERPDFISAISGTDVLLAPHHGRDAGFYAELFNVMGKPRLVVISDGRFGDTSATDRYGKQSRGWTYSNGIGEKITDCKCVTTRKNGHITIKFGWNIPDQPALGNYLNVTTSKPDIWSTLASMLPQ